MASRTPLFDWHLANGARIVDFAGWDMPVQYTSIVEEHNAVRNAAGIFDISHMGRLSFVGDDTLALLQQVFTNNVATMKDFQVRYGLICNEQGGIRDDVLVYRWPYGYAMVVNASNRQKIVAWLSQQKGGRKVEASDRTTATCMIALPGPKAVEMSQGFTQADAGTLGYYFATATTYKGKPCILSRTGYTGEDGLEFIVPAELGVTLWSELLGRGARPCGLGARDTLRLEAAMPLYGHELSEDIDPFQAGLSWAVKLSKGEFIGKGALVTRRENSQLRQRVGLVLGGKRIAREGAVVYHQGREIGKVTSGTFSPTLTQSIAMAYVDPLCTQLNFACDVDIRGKSEPARVAALPFYSRKHK
jgi:aminomethyltransferase